MKRIYMECRDEKSQNFWEITVNGNVTTTRWGRIGAKGQSKKKRHASKEEAEKAAEKLIREKEKKQYAIIKQKGSGSEANGKETRQETPDGKSAPRAALKRNGPVKKIMAKKVSTRRRNTSKAINPLTATKSELLRFVKAPERNDEEIGRSIGRYVEVDRAIARLDKVSPAILSKLSHSSDRATRAAVAANINISASDLIRLGRQFPKEFLANPALDLMLIEQPDLLKAIDMDLVVQIVKRTECHESILAWAAKYDNEKVQQAIATNKNVPPEAIEILSKSRFESVVSAIKNHVAVADAIDLSTLNDRYIEAVSKRIHDLELEELAALWKKKEMTLAQFSELPMFSQLYLVPCSSESIREDDLRGIKDKDSLFKQHYFMNNYKEIRNNHRFFGDDPIFDISELPDSIMTYIAELKDSLYKSNVASKATCPAKLLELLSLDDEPRVQLRVAENENCDSVTLERLAESEHHEIRAAVARNKGCNDTVLSMLAQDNVGDVRAVVASNVNISRALISKLKNDKSSSVRAALVGNPNCPERVARDLIEGLVKNKRTWHELAKSRYCPNEVLALMAKAKSKAIRAAVAINPNCPPKLAFEILNKMRGGMLEAPPAIVAARNPDTPPELLAEMAQKGDEDLRQLVAGNKSTPVESLRKLVHDEAIEVRNALAKNPVCSEDVLRILAEDRESTRYGSPPRYWVAGNPSCPPALFSDLATDYAYRIAENPGCPEDILERLLEIKDKNLHAPIAGNARLSKKSLEKLSLEKNRKIRLAVALNPSASDSAKVCALDNEDMVKTIRTYYFPEGILVKLEQSRHEKVRQAALANTNHPEWKRSFLKDLHSNPWFVETLNKMPEELKKAVAEGNILYFGGKDADKTILSNRDLGAILALSGGARISPQRIARKSKSTDWLIRMAIARNRSTPPNILKRLETDGHVLVSAQAKYTLQLLSRDSSPSSRIEH